MRKRQKLAVTLLFIILSITLIFIFINEAVIPHIALNRSEVDTMDCKSIEIDSEIAYTPIPTPILTSEIDAIDNLLDKHHENLENARIWKQRSEEYPVATQIWLSMKEQGWNDHVCAGILGNIMAECGGHTLSVQWDIYDHSGWFYGICQWSLYYRPEASGLSLENQLSLLYNTIEAEFDYAGFCYYYGFTYDDFLQMTDYRNAALAFAKVYERCSPASHAIRQNNAQIAYEYFAG